jgi:hypothetical protein
MRAWEILTEHEDKNPTSKPITLRLLHKMKLEMRAVEKSRRERLQLLPLIYGNPDRRRERLELERLELELAQMRAEIAATEAETAAKSRNAISDMARLGIKAEKQSDQKITALAKHGMLRRRKKCSTVS